MTYVSLYRRWRPQNFDDIVGQGHVVRTLKNAVSTGRISHAYIFSGPRGTGKTSTARVLARALNCEKGPTPEPCGECRSCVAIRDGNAMDVIEIDAASNRGIEEIRDLREKVMYAPTQGRYKVYIIDEAHMLTQAASNAFLKTLEEPPAHVIFVLATTEPENIIETIRSRCQRFDFNRLSVPDLADHISRVAAAQSISIDTDATKLIARRADGSARDALGLLEQASAWSAHVTSQSVLELLGTSDYDTLYNYADAARRGEPGPLLQIIRDVVESGADMRQFLQDLVIHFRNLLVAKECPDLPGLLDASEAVQASVMKQAAQFERGRIIEILDVLSEAEINVRRSPNPRLVVELAAARICAKPRAGGFVQASPPEAGDPSVPITPKARARGKAGKKDSRSAAVLQDKAADGRAVAPAEGEHEQSGYSGISEEQWNEALTSIKRVNVVLEAFLKPVSAVCVEGGVARVMYDPSWTVHVQKASEPENKELIASTLTDVLGRPVKCEIVARSPKPKMESSGAGASGGESGDYSDVPEVMKAIELFDPVEIEVIED
ncbi:MAG: DNA polymerase III subunit gamma/tau [Firmicutes bacterium]|nr:DNA polymerase III subunit gamma/tau [Bacillota bacterium]